MYFKVNEEQITMQLKFHFYNMLYAKDSGMNLL
jgi:hypothetical protein